MKIMMADGKEISTDVNSPAYIVTADRDSGAKKGGISKKHVLFAVSAVVVVVVVLAAILVGVHMFSETQKEIVKYSLQFKSSDAENVKQDVEADPNDNVVSTHVTKNGQDAQIVSDFNRGMQIVKMKTSEGVNCYITALNKSLALDPLHIAGSDPKMEQNENAEQTFVITEDPVSDRSFLTKKALDMCKGVSLYWVTRKCGESIADNTTVSNSSERNKRAIYYLSRYNGMYGLGGCCKAYWACEVTMVEYIVGNTHICNTYLRTGTCCRPTALYPYGVPYPYCATYYYASWKTPGLYC